MNYSMVNWCERTMFIERKTNTGKKGSKGPYEARRNDPVEEVSQISTLVSSINELKRKIVRTESELRVLD
jgi:hypothetical protein